MKHKAIIDKLSLEQKASLMSGKDFWTTMDIETANIPSIFLADGPTGLRKQKAAADHLGLNESIKSTCFPTSATMANTWNEQLLETVATSLGKEAAIEDVSVVLGPGINIKRNPLGGRNFEYYSEDPYLSGKMGASFIRGIQNNGIAACVKHYAVNTQETRRLAINSIVDERTLREIYLTGFEIAVKEGKTKSLMASYNLLNGTYTNENKHILVDILRNEWGFKGVIVSDWGGSNDRVEALKQSAELEMPTTDGDTNKEIIKAIENKTLEISVLDEAVDRLLDLIFDTREAIKHVEKVLDVELHHLVAQKAAEEAMVLLKNEENILPIKETDKVAIIGDFAKNSRYQGAGSSGVNPTRLDSLLTSLKPDDFISIGYEQGFNRYGRKNKGLAKKAVDLAKKADKVLLFLGLDESSETEGMDRVNILLPDNQISLVKEIAKVNKNIIVVLNCGSVVDMNWDVDVKGLMHAYLPGQAGAKAILNNLTGKTTPSGKLTESYPFSYDDIASSNNFPGLENSAEHREAIYVGYRYYEKNKIDVKYPFGFGLSYTQFTYSDLEVTDKGVRVKITNTGNYSGSEVVQLYIGKKQSDIFRAEKELKGFTKVFLNKNDVKEVFIAFDAYSFRYFNVETNAWETEAGSYQLYVGSSSKDVRLTAEIEKMGTTPKKPYDLNKIPNFVSGDIKAATDDEFEYLLGYKIPNPHFIFYKKKRMVVSYNTTVQQLRYARGWTGRFFNFGVKAARRMLLIFGKRHTANVMMIGLFDLPMRGISRMSGGMVNMDQLDGMIKMFNGHFFKGVGHFLKASKKRKKEKKIQKRETKNHE